MKNCHTRLESCYLWSSELFENWLQIKVLKKITLCMCNILHFLVSALCQSKLNINRQTVSVRVTWPFLKVYLTWKRMLFKRKCMLCNKPKWDLSASASIGLCRHFPDEISIHWHSSLRNWSTAILKQKVPILFGTRCCAKINFLQNH